MQGHEGGPATWPAPRSLPVVLGRYLDRSDVRVDLLEPCHTLLSGPTGMGKSSLCYGVLGQAIRFPQVRVVGADFSGVLLRALPACPLRAGGPDVRAAEQVIKSLVSELDRRLHALDRLGVDSLRADLVRFPLLLLVAEEWPGIVAQARALDADRPRGSAQLAASLLGGLQRLAAESAKVNFRIWLVAQRPDAEIVGGYARSNFQRRISLSGDASALRMVHDDLDMSAIAALRRLPVGGGLIESPTLGRAIFRTDLTSYKSYRRHATSVGCCGAREAEAPQAGLCMSHPGVEAP